jgi:hypothetical protein
MRRTQQKVIYCYTRQLVSTLCNNKSTFVVFDGFSLYLFCSNNGMASLKIIFGEWSSGLPQCVVLPVDADVSGKWSSGLPDFVVLPEDAEVSGKWSSGLPQCVVLPEDAEGSKKWSSGLS